MLSAARAVAARRAASPGVTAVAGRPRCPLAQVLRGDRGRFRCSGVLRPVGAAVAQHAPARAHGPVLAVPLGVAMALVLRRPDLPGRAFWRVAVLLPVLVPDFVLGYSWTQAYARAGFTDTVLGLSWPGLSGRSGCGWSSS